MAKLTDGQKAEAKAAAKDASSLKRAAHSARVKELREAEEAAKLKVNSSPEFEAFDNLSNEFDRVLERRRVSIAEIQSQIDVLIEKQKAVNIEFDSLLNSAKEAKNAASVKYFALCSRSSDPMLLGFPDLDGNNRWSFAGWNPPAGYIEKFAADNADALAKKKAKREKAALTK